MIPYGRQDITEDDIEQVVAVLRSDFLTQGPKVPLFEKAVSDYCGAAHGVAANSATSALHIAALALGVGPGDMVWTTPITFVASANCALYCGADVDFVDIDPVSYNLCAQKLARKLEACKKQGGRMPKLVIPVHLGGMPCDMAAIHALSKQYGFAIIEDASHAIGGRYKDAPIGNCAWSDITIFSFHPVKIITTGEGGMALTNDGDVAQKMQLYRSHGVTRNPDLMCGDSHGPWYYEQIALGYNYRMTDINAALGINQMTRLDANVAARHKLAARYDRAFDDLPLTLAPRQKEAYSGRHLYVILLDLDHMTSDHLTVFNQLRDRGIGVNLHYIPIHLQPYYRKLGFRQGDFPVAEDYYARAISLPLFPSMTVTDQEKVIAAVKDMVK